MPSSTSIPIIVQGNSFSLAIPLQIYVIQDGEMVLQDYTPDPTDQVSIQLKGTRRNYTYTPSMAGNIATIGLSGNELADNYAVVVSIVKANGQRLRSFRTDQFFIVESSDDLTQDDIIAGLEENVIYLNAQAFISLGEVVISDSTTTFDANSALSAKQGAILRENIELLLSSLGEYAFPTGKPSLDWSGGALAVTLNLSNFSSSNMAQTIQRGEAYTTTLTATDLGNLYVPNVVIKMGDEDITATAYNPTTGVVNIAEVTGAIEITAQQVTYVQDGLVFNLDGLNRGGNAGHWVDLVGNTDFALTNCTENTDNVAFNGTSSKGVSSGALNVLYNVGTMEAIFDVSASDFPTSVQCVLTNNLDDGISIGLGKGAQPDTSKSVYCYANDKNGSVPVTGLFGFDDVITTKQQVSISKGSGFRNGDVLADPYPANKISFSVDSTTPLAIGYRKRSSSENFMKGQIFAIRVYNRVLTAEERAQNYLVDKKRYNFGV